MFFILCNRAGAARFHPLYVHVLIGTTEIKDGSSRLHRRHQQVDEKEILYYTRKYSLGFIFSPESSGLEVNVVLTACQPSVWFVTIDHEAML